MTDPFEQPGKGPADPPGYSITVEDEQWVVVRVVDDVEIGRYPTKESAVEAAMEDRRGSAPE